MLVALARPAAVAIAASRCERNDAATRPPTRACPEWHAEATKTQRGCVRCQLVTKNHETESTKTFLSCFSVAIVGAMVETTLVVQVQPDGVRKGSYCFVRGNVCRLDVCDILPKATANGNRRLHIKGKDVFTGKIYEDTVNVTAGFHGIDVPVVEKKTYGLMDLDAETGFLSLLTESGDCKEDVGLSLNADEATLVSQKWDTVGFDLSNRFDLRVTVLSIMGKELVVGVEHDSEA